MLLLLMMMMMAGLPSTAPSYPSLSSHGTCLPPPQPTSHLHTLLIWLLRLEGGERRDKKK